MKTNSNFEIEVPGFKYDLPTFASIQYPLFLVLKGQRVKKNDNFKNNLIDIFMGRAIFFILFLTLISCGISQEKTVPEHTTCDSVFTIINEKAWDKRFDELGIKSIEESISKTQIRIWIQGPGSVDSARLLILRKDEVAWASEFHQYRFSGSKDSIDILVNHEVTKSVPKSGWDSYIANIEKNGIYMLNDKDRKKALVIVIMENPSLCKL